MSIVTTTHHVMRYSNRAEFAAVQRLERHVQVLGVTVWVDELDSEDVPSWALIERACLGSTEWKSRLLKQYAHLLGDQA